MPNENRTLSSVHMLFVFFPVFIVFLSSSKKVVDRALLTPWQINYTPKNAAKYFIELPEEFEKSISISDTLDWK